MSKKREIRTIARELRVKPDTNTLAGYIAVFNSWSEDLCGFREKLAPGCFKSSLNNDVVGLINHDTSAVVGRTTSKTLRLSEDDKGLAFECDLPETTRAKDLVISVQRGDVTGCSFGFYCTSDQWDYDKDGSAERTVLDVELFEVSVGVTFPAYPDAEAHIRSLFPDGIIAKPEKRDEQGLDNPITDGKGNNAASVGDNAGKCECACKECRANLCNDCSNVDCQSEYCCHRSKKEDDEDDDDERSRMSMKVRLAKEI